MELHVPHFSVKSILGKQLVMRSFFKSSTILKHDNFIGVSNCPKSMGNNQNCPLGAKPIKRKLNAVLCKCVERSRCLIEQNEGRVLEKVRIVKINSVSVSDGQLDSDAGFAKSVFSRPNLHTAYLEQASSYGSSLLLASTQLQPSIANKGFPSLIQ